MSDHALPSVVFALVKILKSQMIIFGADEQHRDGDFSEVIMLLF